jgi:hypothetical protein
MRLDERAPAALPKGLRPKRLDEERSLRACSRASRPDVLVTMKVVAASLDNGLLYVDVVHEVPEAAKPGTIKIGTTVGTVQPEVTEQKAA